MLKDFKLILYQLKKEFGLTVTFNSLTSATVDLESGLESRTYDGKEIKKAIVLPSRVYRDFKYDLSFIGENKNFTYGAYYDNADRVLIIEKRDLGDYVVKLDHWIIFNNRRWNISQLEEFDDNKAYIIGVKETQSQELNRVIIKTVYDHVYLDSEVVNE